MWGCSPRDLGRAPCLETGGVEVLTLRLGEGTHLETGGVGVLTSRLGEGTCLETGGVGVMPRDWGEQFGGDASRLEVTLLFWD